MPERMVFHVDMNAFFAALEQQCHPRLRGRPIVVCGNAKTRTVVAACSYEAKAFGIKNGMAVGEARRLCPGLVCVGGDPQKYVDVARRLFALMARDTPRVEVFSIDEAFLDMTETRTPPEAAARDLKQRIRRAVGLTCSIGIGPNKLIAKVASDLQKPDGLVRVTAAEVPALMARLPIESLCGIGPRLQAVLNDFGIHTCAQLGEAPEALLVARFGVIGRALKRMGQGRDDSPVASYDAVALANSMGHSYTLPRDTDDLEDIAGTLLRLAEQVARRLREDHAQGRTVHLTVRYADFSGLLRHATLQAPTDSGLRIAQAARRLFQEHCEPLPQRVRLLGVGLSGLTRRLRQPSFLPEDRRLERLDACLDRVNNRFGEWSLVRASAATPFTPKSHGFLLHKRQRRRGLILT